MSVPAPAPRTDLATRWDWLHPTSGPPAWQEPAPPAPVPAEAAAPPAGPSAVQTAVQERVPTCTLTVEPAPSVPNLPPPSSEGTGKGIRSIQSSGAPVKVLPPHEVVSVSREPDLPWSEAFRGASSAARLPALRPIPIPSPPVLIPASRTDLATRWDWLHPSAGTPAWQELAPPVPVPVQAAAAPVGRPALRTVVEEQTPPQIQTRTPAVEPAPWIMKVPAPPVRVLPSPGME